MTIPPLGRSATELPERFWEKVDKQGPVPEHAKHLGPCWQWTGSDDGQGYGAMSWDGKSTKVHRLAFEACIGPIADGMFVCHRCDNRRCCRPEHLFQGTALDNTRDKFLKGRQGLPPVVHNARMEIRLSKPDHDAVLEAAKQAGVNKSEWCRRVFANVLGTPQVETGPSEAKGAPTEKRSGPVPVPSEAVNPDPSEGVRPAVQSQTPSRLARPRTSMPCMSCGEPREGCMGPEGHSVPTMKRADAEAKPERMAQSDTAVGRAIVRGIEDAETVRRATVNAHRPNCKCPVCVPPKVGKGK